jgi:hypothetical protein
MFVALLLVMGATALTANFALAVEDHEGIIGLKMITTQMSQELQSRAARLGTSAGTSDTTWVGYTPGFFNASNNYWSIYSGLGKDGYRRPVNGQPDKGVWNWDRPDPNWTPSGQPALTGDSLMGWWPVRYLSSESILLDFDYDRPHTCIDHGNQVNYVINQRRGANWQNEGTGNLPGWRTFGVDGVWHRDGGSPVAVPGWPAPAWLPLGGTHSAWMGLRAGDDNSYVDPLTGNAFNENVIIHNQSNSAAALGNDRTFPGYGSQMDQMLYRDIDFAGKTTANLTVSYRFRHNMSTTIQNANATQRFGWFDKDPLSPTPGGTPLNNFISGTVAGTAGAPRDSFMVYIGSGVDNNLWRGSDGVDRPLYDKKHRWFAEVLHADTTMSPPLGSNTNPQPRFYKELMSVAGDRTTPADTSFTISNAVLAPFLAKNNKIRLVFRVKTNIFNDDEGVGGRPYNSGRQGAAVVDNVTYQIGSNPVVNFGDFESPTSIDNNPAISALDAWKSTGKPPAIYDHVERLGSVSYLDICGQKGEVTRICDMAHGIISYGDHDRGEEMGGTDFNEYDLDRRHALVSPTIVFAATNGAGVKNVHGLLPFNGVSDQPNDTFASEDYYFSYNQYGEWAGDANFWRFRVYSFPSKKNSTAHPSWGQGRQPPFIFFNPIGRQCFTDNFGLNVYSLFRHANPVVPDSLKIAIKAVSLCYSFAPVSLPGCGSRAGYYFDNVSLGIVDGTPAQLSVDIWQWINDAFPFNESTGYPGNAALFDTTTAHIQTGLNISPDTNDFTRCHIPGDSIAIASSNGTARVDMVFRILPGPGNYHPVGDGHTGNLRKKPNAPLSQGGPCGLDCVTPGDGTWWDVLRTNTGDFSSNPGGPMTNLKAGWNPNFWLSVRTDTAEVNIYSRVNNLGGGPLDPARWMSTVHESDKRFALLGNAIHGVGGIRRCFVTTETGPASSIVCDGSVPTYLPAGTLGTTYEFNKIIPDGYLTPGAHVQYFFRDQKDSKIPGAPDGFCPDTNTVFPQITEGPSFDAHRWQQFGVLPDRWKDPLYLHPVDQTFGRGPACLLVVDWNDRRGDERVWVSVADTIGATAQQRWGAHNGWHAIGNVSQGEGVGVNDPGYFGQTPTGARVARHGGQPGTTWDLYQVKASESIDSGVGGLGGRLAFQCAGLAGPKSARNAPTPEMLDAYYTLMLILTGDLNAFIFGPYENQVSDDVGIITGWLNNGSTTAQNRGIWAIGDGFIENCTLNATSAAVVSLAEDYFRATLIDRNFQQFANVADFVVDLRVFPEWQGKDPNPAEGHQIYGMRNQCTWTNDVIAVSTPLLTSVTSEYRRQVNPVSGYNAGVFKDWDPNFPWKSVVDAWDLVHLATQRDITTVGRSGYMYKVFVNVWSKIWAVHGIPVVPLDVPTFEDGGLVNFVNVLGNPMYSARATIKFGLAKSDFVELKVFDVSGRLIRTLANHQFSPGTHDIVWDGLDNSGRQVARGVYFTQVKFRAQRFEEARKLIVLR